MDQTNENSSIYIEMHKKCTTHFEDIFDESFTASVICCSIKLIVLKYSLKYWYSWKSIEYTKCIFFTWKCE